MEESVTGTRILSARRSKPDMAALVDQHRTMNTYIPVRRPEMIFEDRIPIVSIENLHSDDSLSSTRSPEPQSMVIRKRVSHRPKRLPKLRLKTVANGSSARGLHTSRTLSLHADPDTHELETTTIAVVANSTDEEPDDADDDIPLSSFVPVKPVEMNSPSPLPTSPSKPDPQVVLCQCTRPAVLDDPRWDGQYCSPECLISVCHRAFEFWLRMHRNSSGISSF